MKITLKSVVLGLGLLLCQALVHGAPSTQNAEVSIAPAVNIFDQVQIGSESANRVITITNHALTPVTVTSAPVIAGLNASQFTLKSTTCGSGALVLNQNASCEVQVTFSPVRFGSQTAYVEVPTNLGSGATFVAFLSNDEDRQMEARRRFPAVLMGLNVLNGGTEVDITSTALAADTAYTLQWTLLGYDPQYKSQADFFACGTSEPGEGDACWASSVETVSDDAPSTGSQNYWRYYDQNATLYTFSQSFTIDSADLDVGDNYVGLRFFYQGGVDVNDPAKPPVSLILPGNIDNIATSGAAKTGYIGTTGRLMFITVNK